MARQVGRPEGPGVRAATAHARASWGALNTPARILVLAVGSVVLVLLMLLLLNGVVRSAQGSQQTVVHEAIPAVLADRGIARELADMDAQSADWLLVGRRSLGATEADVGAAYYADRSAAIDALEAAAADPIGGEALRHRINDVLTGLTTYHGYSLQAQLLADQGDARGALSQYRLATDLMHRTLQPEIDAITNTHIHAVDNGYRSERVASTAGIGAVVGLGLVVLTWLTVAQYCLFRWTRRLVNPGLLAATALLVAVTIGATAALVSVAGATDGAKQQAYDSALALSSAREAGYDANADKSRYVLDGFRSSQYEQDFNAQSLQIVGLPGSPQLASFDTSLASAVISAEQGNITFGGDLGTVLRNSTFDGVRPAVLHALQARAAYERGERQLHQMVIGGRADAAVIFDTGANHGQSEYDFQQFDAGISRAITIDNAHLAAYTKQGDDALSGWGWLPLVALPAILLLVLGGLWPRYSEYRA